MSNLFRDNIFNEFPDPNKKIEELTQSQGYTKYFVNAKEAGAKGDGTDETAILQQALDLVPSGGEFHFPSDKAFKFTTLVVKKTDVKITGKGKLTGTIVIDAPLTVNEMIFDISGVLFDNVDLTKNAIEVKRARRGFIKGCTFKNCDKTIFANPPTGAADHSIGQLIIDGNHFYGVNYAFYVSKGGNASWMITNDCHFTNNIINVAKKSHVYCESIDGLVVDGNTCFFPNYASQDQVKEFNIYIGGQSDWVIIVNNNLFEAGKDAIKLVNPKRFTIGNNLIAWCGQRDLSDGINITGTSSHKGTISNNIMTYVTKHGITLDQNGEVTVTGNNIEYSATPPSYYGATAMSSITHYALYVTDTNPQSKKVITVGNIHQGLDIYNKGLTPYRFVGVRERKFSKSITAANTPICTLGSDNGDTAQYDGQAIIRASNTDSLTGNTASYILHIGKHAVNSHVNKISDGGLVSGGSANHPSFTFSIDTTNNQLLATPVGSTSGTFYFYVTLLHNLTMI